MSREQNINRYVKILAYDPGLSSGGWALLIVDTKTGEIHFNRGGILKVSQIIGWKKYATECELFGARIVALGILEQQFYDHAEKYNPVYVAVEGVYFIPGKPKAYEALLQWVTQLELAMYRWRKQVHRIPTKTAKQCVTSSGGADKPTVQAALLSLTDLKIQTKQRSLLENNNIADALAVGYTFARMAMPELMANDKEQIKENDQV